MDLGLQEQGTALVAASSKGLGYGVAKALAANGAKRIALQPQRRRCRRRR